MATLNRSGAIVAGRLAILRGGTVTASVVVSGSWRRPIDRSASIALGRLKKDGSARIILGVSLTGTRSLSSGTPRWSTFVWNVDAWQVTPGGELVRSGSVILGRPPLARSGRIISGVALSGTRTPPAIDRTHTPTGGAGVQSGGLAGLAHYSAGVVLRGSRTLVTGATVIQLSGAIKVPVQLAGNRAGTDLIVRSAAVMVQVTVRGSRAGGGPSGPVSGDVTVTLRRPDLFPDGTVVGIYPRRLPIVDGAPVLPVIAAAEVAGDEVSFGGLESGTAYECAGLVGGVWRRCWVSTDEVDTGKAGAEDLVAWRHPPTVGLDTTTRAGFTFASVCDVFPVGSTIAVFEAPSPTGPAAGTVAETSTVGPDGSLAFSELRANTPYVARDPVTGLERRFRTREPVPV